MNPTLSDTGTPPQVEDCLFENVIYQEYFAVTGRRIWFRPVDIAFDLTVIHSWMNRPHVVEFWDMAWPVERIEDYLRKAAERPGFDTYIAYMDSEPFAYFEAYDPTRDRIGAYYDAQSDDVGLHILIGEEKYMRKFIIRLSVTLMRFVFTTWPETRRVVGEPDERNRQVLGLMKFLGFRFLRKIQLPEKKADFLILHESDFRRAHG